MKVCNVILEAVLHKIFEFGTLFFGTAGSHNDINVLQRSLVFERLVEGNCPEFNIKINGHHYNKGYYLPDGIYPQCITLVKTIPNPIGEKRQ